MNIVFMGTPDFAAGILKSVLEAGYTVTHAVTQPDKPSGRKLEIVPCAVKKAAEDIRVSAFRPTPGKHCDFCEFRLICEAWK